MYEPTLQALRGGDATGALAAARDLVAAQPNDPTAHRLLAAALRLGGDRAGAIAAVDHALGLAPDDASLHLERAGLLLAERQVDEAQAALARTIGLDPNQFPAYIVQAQLAIGRGDLDEAERISRIAARIAPEHPHVAAIEGTLALRRGDADRSLAILSTASSRFPDEPQLRHALGFAYLAKGHFAFAEQAFRGMLERDPASRPLRALVADVVRRQGRAAEAADELLPLLDGDDASPALHMLVGEMELEAGRNERALERLLTAFAAQPGNPRTLGGLVEAWRRLGDQDGARQALDQALAEHPREPGLWHARLAVEPFAGDEARAIVQRWIEAMPDFIPSLEAQVTLHDVAGDAGAAEAVARRITELEPGHTQAELRVLDGLMRREPTAAIARVQDLLGRAEDPNVKRSLRQLLGHAFDAAGDRAAAVATWAGLHAEVVDRRLPLPTPTDALGELPPLAPVPDPAPAVLWLWGAPGSLVERIALNFEMTGGPLRADRYGATPPTDALQRYGTAQALVDGQLDGAALVAEWRAALPGRGIDDGQVFDWLLWWDNALLHALRPHLPEAVVMFAVRDPRDMLLEWLAHGSPAPFALASPEVGAQWLATMLGQIADVHEGELFPHRLVKMDDIAADPVALAQAVGDALEFSLPTVPAEALGPVRFAAGHWRAYAEPLAAAFATLAPVARRLGYAD
ncbi:tetratricopeptide repeat protein [Cognatilysobacter tabacisoli]|uniref:tetratricopeptide repeat protein n=1 Tax=Cognatilysobacter tabacisoli TaxID=2315424 RepID=UPI000E6B37C6|nr:tetratricopeptide repeat protein [Lysobacter tabacisoli]